MTTGKRIQAARKSKGLSQQQLGELLGVSGSMIGQYENNLRNPKNATLIKIGAALGVAPESLLGDDEIKQFNKVRQAVFKSLTSALSNPNLSKIKAEIPVDNLNESEFVQSILQNIKLLNEEGLEKADDFIKDLLKISEYGKKEAARD